MTVKVFFMRYPELHQFLLNELAEGCNSSTSLTIHSVLLILSRLYPSSLDDKRVNVSLWWFKKNRQCLCVFLQLEEYLPLLNRCLSHAFYRTRELAAAASISFIPQSDYPRHIVKLLIVLSNQKISNNQLHGVLLQVIIF